MWRLRAGATSIIDIETSVQKCFSCFDKNQTLIPLRYQATCLTNVVQVQYVAFNAFGYLPVLPPPETKVFWGFRDEATILTELTARPERKFVRSRA